MREMPRTEEMKGFPAAVDAGVFNMSGLFFAEEQDMRELSQGVRRCDWPAVHDAPCLGRFIMLPATNLPVVIRTSVQPASRYNPSRKAAIHP
jgi:hypothetical protein